MQQGRRRITVDLGSAELYRTLRLAAVERDSSMREVIVQALEEWLNREQADDSVTAGGVEVNRG
ncbi:MAG: hypothetical protein O2826_06665 [Chloroflexi bacterium]|nr:hypothetical protein [Chloroflexota bacterium]